MYLPHAAIDVTEYCATNEWLLIYDMMRYDFDHLSGIYDEPIHYKLLFKNKKINYFVQHNLFILYPSSFCSSKLKL